MGSSPTARSLDYCRKHGLEAGVVERWCQYSRKRHDLFGFIDIVILDADSSDIVAVQATSGANHASRRRKILAEPRAVAWCKAGGSIEVWSWSKRPGATKRKVWTLRREEVCP